MKLILVFLVLLVGCFGCSETEPVGSGSGGPIQVVATTGMVADAVAVVGGDAVEVDFLMGPGVDPHLFKASASDTSKLSKADAIFYNGLHLEGKMVDILAKMKKRKPTFAVAEGIDAGKLHTPEDYEGLADPHIWFDVALWIEAVNAVEVGLIEVAPEHAEMFTANADAYRAELTELHEWTRSQIATIPKEQRVLVTAHDAFGYFGSAYDVEVVGLQGISTVSNFSVADVERISDLLVERKIRAIFVESSVPEKAIEAVIEGCGKRGHTVVKGGTLFSDAMGEAGTPEGTFVGMVRANVNTIVHALKGEN
jgi:manganese/zinc/iron transport system substrate-binding protein